MLDIFFGVFMLAAGYALGCNWHMVDWLPDWRLDAPGDDGNDQGA